MNRARIVVVGHGIAPAIAAIAIARAFGRGGIEVEWIETPGGPSAHGVVAALPNARAFHRLLGLDQGALVRDARGVFTLGRQYVGFAGREREHLHSYGPVGRPIAGLPFAQFWYKARASGLPAGFADFARESVAARNGRIRIADGPRAQSTAYGHHLDARAYAAILRAHALRQGIAITPDRAPVAVAQADRVSAVRLDSGRVVHADLFVDTTQGATILSALGDGNLANAAVSSCDRLLLGSGPALSPLPLYSRVVAHRAGWSALHPLPDRTGVTIAFDSALMDDAEAARSAGMPLSGTAEIVPLAPIQRMRPWIGNVVAMGDAAGEAEPIGATWLHRLQIAVTHFISLFPVRMDAIVEAAIYNEELAEWHARLRDFDAAAYALNRRSGEPFWEAAKARAISEPLAARLSLFGARGMVAQYNQDSFTEDEWQARFLGFGIEPRGWDPQIDRVDEALAMADFRNQLAEIRADVMAMDTHEAALAKAIAR